MLKFVYALGFLSIFTVPHVNAAATVKKSDLRCLAQCGPKKCGRNEKRANTCTHWCANPKPGSKQEGKLQVCERFSKGLILKGVVTPVAKASYLSPIQRGFYLVNDEGYCIKIHVGVEVKEGQKLTMSYVSSVIREFKSYKPKTCKYLLGQGMGIKKS